MSHGLIVTILHWGALVAAAEPAPRPTDATHQLAVGDRVILLHERLEVTHVVATRRPQDLRSKEILVGDGVAVGDVEGFFRSSKVSLAAIPVGTSGVVRGVVEPWQAGNELRAGQVKITSGPLAGQEWWVSAPGLAVRGTPEGDRRLKNWRLLIRAGRLKDPRTIRAHVSPDPAVTPPTRSRTPDGG